MNNALKIALIIAVVYVLNTRIAPLFFNKVSGRKFPSDSIEKRYFMRGSLLAKIQPSGNMFKDFSAFVFAQGGGKSADPNDPAAYFLPSKPDRNGVYYHTVKDITYAAFVTNAKKIGYKPSPALFYEMPESIRKKIIQIFLKGAKHCKSDLINYFLGYCHWGTGDNANHIIRMFKNSGTTLQAFLNKNGEAKTLCQCAYFRLIFLAHLSTSGLYFRGWAQGVSNFLRVFKMYCKS